MEFCPVTNWSNDDGLAGELSLKITQEKETK